MSRIGMLAGAEYARFSPTDPQASLPELAAFLARKAREKDHTQMVGLLVLAAVLVAINYGNRGPS